MICSTRYGSILFRNCDRPHSKLCRVEYPIRSMVLYYRQALPRVSRDLSRESRGQSEHHQRM